MGPLYFPALGLIQEKPQFTGRHLAAALNTCTAHRFDKIRAVHVLAGRVSHIEIYEPALCFAVQIAAPQPFSPAVKNAAFLVCGFVQQAEQLIDRRQPPRRQAGKTGIVQGALM